MTEKKREQVEADLRTIIKGSKKSIFVKLTLTELIKTSRRMYQIYDAYKSGEKFKINNDDDKISLLRIIDNDFQNLKTKIKKIPDPLKNLLDRKWESEPNSKHSREGSTSIILKNLSDLHVEFSKNLLIVDGFSFAMSIFSLLLGSSFIWSEFSDPVVVVVTPFDIFSIVSELNCVVSNLGKINKYADIPITNIPVNKK